MATWVGISGAAGIGLRVANPPYTWQVTITMKRVSSRVLVLTVVLLPLVFLGQGCIMLAVRGVKMMDRPQKMMIAFGNYFDDRVSVSVWLAPVTKHSKVLGAVTGDEEVGILNPAEEEEPEPMSAAPAPPPPADASTEDPTFHKKLFVVLRNISPSDEKITVVSVKSALGDLNPRPANLLLAPTQRVILAPMLSKSEPKIESLDVVVSLREGDKVETHTLRLLPRVKD